jgi:hypothetical protein
LDVVERVTRSAVGDSRVYGAAAVHLLTMRAADSLAIERLNELRAWWDEQLDLAPSDPGLARRFRVRLQQRFFTEYDNLLDQNLERDPFVNCSVAALIRRQLYQQQAGYRLLAYAVMPNHVHVVLATREESSETCDGAAIAAPFQEEMVPTRMDEQPDVRSPLIDYLRQFKRTTVEQAAALADGGVKLTWESSSFDYWVRSPAERDAIIEYVAENPISAGLVRSREQWFFCSAHDRFLHDGQTCGWLPNAQ